MKVTLDQREKKQKRLSVASDSDLAKRLDQVICQHARSSPSPDGRPGHHQPTSQVEGDGGGQEGEGGPGHGGLGLWHQDTDLPGDQSWEQIFLQFVQLPAKFVGHSSESAGLLKVLAYYDK